MTGGRRAWTVSRRGPSPTLYALLRLDGADTALLHRLLDVEPDAVRSGMRVTAVLEQRRQGQITDIAGFRPLAGAAAGKDGS